VLQVGLDIAAALTGLGKEKEKLRAVLEAVGLGIGGVTGTIGELALVAACWAAALCVRLHTTDTTYIHAVSCFHPAVAVVGVINACWWLVQRR